MRGNLARRGHLSPNSGRNASRATVDWGAITHGGDGVQRVGGGSGGGPDDRGPTVGEGWQGAGWQSRMVGDKLARPFGVRLVFKSGGESRLSECFRAARPSPTEGTLLDGRRVPPVGAGHPPARWPGTDPEPPAIRTVGGWSGRGWFRRCLSGSVSVQARGCVSPSLSGAVLGWIVSGVGVPAKQQE